MATYESGKRWDINVSLVRKDISGSTPTHRVVEFGLTNESPAKAIESAIAMLTLALQDLK